MKKILLYVLVVYSLFATSCTNEDYIVYDANQKSKISFVNDTVKFNYGFEIDKEIDLSIPVNLIGFVSKDKEVNFKVDIVGGDANQGVEFNIVESSFKVDSTVAYVKIDFKKDALIFDKTYKLIFELKENDSYVGTSKIKCLVLFGNNKMEQPKWWKPELLGTYTQEKHIMFVNKFWTTEELSPVIYKKIAITDNFKRNLDGTYLRWGADYTHTLLTIAAYTDFFRRYVTIPMYEYYIQSGDERYMMPNPQKQ